VVDEWYRSREREQTKREEGEKLNPSPLRRRRRGGGASGPSRFGRTSREGSWLLLFTVCYPFLHRPFQQERHPPSSPPFAVFFPLLQHPSSSLDPTRTRPLACTTSSSIYSAVSSLTKRFSSQPSTRFFLLPQYSRRPLPPSSNAVSYRSSLKQREGR
jgi:hypothetical protein